MEQSDILADTCDTPVQDGNDSSYDIEKQWKEELLAMLDDLQAAAELQPGDVLVVGASSSEVIGQRIGTATSMAVGELVVDACLTFQANYQVNVAFQCCEHLNRALVVPRALAKARGWQEVGAIPVPGAGGSVAAVAHLRMENACLVESIQADAGIDIGDTFIGMHLKRVAVPVRGRRTSLGSAHVTMARTRPPLVGGPRAVYDRTIAAERIQAKREM